MDTEEMQLLRQQRNERKMRKTKELYYFEKCIKFTSAIYICVVAMSLGLYITVQKEFDFQGQVEDSCQDLGTLKRVNDQIFPLLDKLTYTKFFRIFRVNLENDCPFWVSDFICTNKKCSVCTCNTTELPQDWLLPYSSPIKNPNKEFDFWDTERIQSPSEWIWHVEDLENDKGVYVDLKLNNEAYTGYQGQHIWHTIYNENCFKGDVDSMCKQERVFNKLISGLHASITTQASEFYIDLKRNITYPNYPFYFRGVGDYPERIKNLFFIYSVLLRALILAEPGIRAYNINSMSFEEDIQAKQLLNGIYKIADSQCSMPFDEKTFFSEITFDTKKHYQKYIHNISRIMDCVECEKCKVFGKMQTYGLGTAFKILFSDSPSEFSGRLKRNELVALVNAFGKISSSINSIDLMFTRRKRYYENIVITTTVVGAFIIAFLMIAKLFYQQLDLKIKKMFNGIPTESNRYGQHKQKRD